MDVPRSASEVFASRRYVPVEGVLEGILFRSTLVPKGNGHYRLYLNGEMRKAARVGEGDTVKLELWLDTQSRELPMPSDLRIALRGKPGGESVFSNLSAFKRREILRWLLAAKRPETRAKRIHLILTRIVH